jgi:hypothetical protein
MCFLKRNKDKKPKRVRVVLHDGKKLTPQQEARRKKALRDLGNQQTLKEFGGK